MPRGWTTVTRGVHRPEEATDVLGASLCAWQAVLPDHSCFTHLSGALLLGLWLPWLPPDVLSGGRVWAQVPRSAGGVRRVGVKVMRSDLTASPTLLHRGNLQLTVAPVGDVLLTLAADLDPTDLLVAVDSAFQLGLTDRGTLDRVASLRRRGAPALRRVLTLADGRSESPWETVLRELHRVAEVPVTPQFEVRNGAGAFVARGDLRVVGHRVLHEYDGDRHLEVERQRADLRRARRLEAAGWLRRGYTSDDLLRRPHEVMADLDRTLDRPGSPLRLQAWRRLVASSAVSAAGRRALWARLAR